MYWMFGASGEEAGEVSHRATSHFQVGSKRVLTPKVKDVVRTGCSVGVCRAPRPPGKVPPKPLVIHFDNMSAPPKPHLSWTLIVNDVTMAWSIEPRGYRSTGIALYGLQVDC